jgi:hypothetical protein
MQTFPSKTVAPGRLIPRAGRWIAGARADALYKGILQK